ncbi:MAG TPA: inverse autotransporter beta domain-containing protein [Deltaproteobacteria bacterium]|nr:inverse autotransporter beta domain-containing protein [Deltaproteobacteria bacterium]HPR56197.1 inverse autotransporter beta domain-containing protein [Deltaproteobacteria bacterium]HXK46428.1 inverse autotransporter beta domain-containing protein [Deltaproteobacteria bacterium]
MKKLLAVVIFFIMGSATYAASPEFIWAGGGLKISSDSNPCYFADSFILLTQVEAMSLFTQPMVTFRGGKPGFDLGVGGRTPMLNGQIIGGWNLFVDYTSNNSHKRIGTGIEVFHPNFSGHMNLYLPVSGEEDDEEALPGLDLNVGIPIPNAPFLSLWPGFYYYAGDDREDMGGMSMVLRAQPIKPLVVSLGGRNDALQAGRDRSEFFLKVEFTVPFDRIGKDLFAFDVGGYPVDIRNQMDSRVMREEFITFEHKRR